MSLETSRKVLKISGILSIIFGVLGIIMGILVFTTGGMIATSVDMGVEDNAMVAGISLAGGIMAVIAGIIALIEGIFSLRGAKDSTKIMPAWVFAIIGLIFGVINLIGSFGNGASSIFSNVISLLISALIFAAANTIKRSR